MSTRHHRSPGPRRARVTAAVLGAVMTVSACGSGPSGGDDGPTKSASPSASPSNSTSAAPAGYANRSFCANASDYGLINNIFNGFGPDPAPTTPAQLKPDLDRLYFSIVALAQKNDSAQRRQQAATARDFWTGVRRLYIANDYRYTKAMGAKIDALGAPRKDSNIAYLKYLDQRCGRGIGNADFAQRPEPLAD